MDVIINGLSKLLLPAKYVCFTRDDGECEERVRIVSVGIRF